MNAPVKGQSRLENSHLPCPAIPRDEGSPALGDERRHPRRSGHWPHLFMLAIQAQAGSRKRTPCTLLSRANFGGGSALPCSSTLRDDGAPDVAAWPVCERGGIRFPWCVRMAYRGRKLPRRRSGGRKRIA